MAGRHYVERLTAGEGLPAPDNLPRFVAPLPRQLENLGLRLAVPIALLNLAGTAFGFWYYLPQFGMTPPLAWPIVPDSPTATLFIALSLLAWRYDASPRLARPLHALAFLGCIKLGGWTPFVLLAFREEFAYLHVAMYNFLFWSHLAMILEAFLIHRYFDFPVNAVAVAVGWYLLNDLLDYFIPVLGGPHHSLLPSEPLVLEAGREVVQHSVPAHDLAAAGAVTLTVLGTFLALSTRVAKIRMDGPDEAPPTPIE